MQKIIGMCGMLCNNCPAFIATQNNDDKQRQKIAERWSKRALHLEVKDINCDGCTTAGGRLFASAKNCEVRLCGIAKKIENCVRCSEYPCEKRKPCFERLSDV